jgi:hypothetical protein
VGGIALIIVSLVLSLSKIRKITLGKPYEAVQLKAEKNAKIPLNSKDLAKDLILSSEISQTVEESIEQSTLFLKNPAHRDPVIFEQRRKAYEPILAEFEKNKESTKKEMHALLSVQLQSKFTPQEMAELIEALNSPANKKFLELRKSIEFLDVLAIPSVKIKEIQDKKLQKN